MFGASLQHTVSWCELLSRFQVEKCPNVMNRGITAMGEHWCMGISLTDLFYCRVSHSGSFCAILGDGSVVTWGDQRTDCQVRRSLVFRGFSIFFHFFPPIFSSVFLSWKLSQL